MSLSTRRSSSQNANNMKVYGTKYALTQGIISRDRNRFHKPDWHETKEEAIARAELMRLRKLSSLNKAIKKLQAIDFTKIDFTK